jgi:nucleotide-binding universal stress UspA family protein
VEKEARNTLERMARGLSRSQTGKKLAIASALRFGAADVEIVRAARSARADLIVLGKHGRRIIRDLFLGSTAETVIRRADTPVLVVSAKVRNGYHRPLVAADLEDTPDSTADLAVRATAGAAELSVVHAYRFPFEGFIRRAVTPQEANLWREEARLEAWSNLNRVLKRMGEAVRWKASVRYGDPRHVILREIKARRADLIVIGTHGRSGVAHALLGSVAQHVIRTAPCDVLVDRPVRSAAAGL